jgi:hypothetical protein
MPTNFDAQLRVASSRPKGATVFAYRVHDPERYGVVEYMGTHESLLDAAQLEELAQPLKKTEADNICCACCPTKFIEHADSKCQCRINCEMDAVLPDAMQGGEAGSRSRGFGSHAIRLHSEAVRRKKTRFNVTL